MSPGEVVKTGELNVYQGQLFHVGFQCARVSFVAHFVAYTCNAQKVQAKLIYLVQLADRKPFAGGPLDPRLVCPCQHDGLAATPTAATTELNTPFAGDKQQVSTVPNLWPEAGGLHRTFW